MCMYMSILRQYRISYFRVSGEDLKAIFMEILFPELPSGVTQLRGPGEVIASVWQAWAQTMGQAMSELKVNVTGSASFLGWSRRLEPKFPPEVPPAEGTKPFHPDTRLPTCQFQLTFIGSSMLPALSGTSDKSEDLRAYATLCAGFRGFVH